MKKQKKRLSVGIDFGTSWSKLILRDEAARAGERFIVVRPSKKENGNSSFRIPSLAVFENDAFSFGFLASQSQNSPTSHIYTSFKMHVAYPQQTATSTHQPPEGIAYFDICALYVCSLMQHAYKGAKRYLANQHLGDLTPEILPTLGVPMAYYQDAEIRQRFVEIALQSFFMFRNFLNNDGIFHCDLTQESISRDEAIKALVHARIQAQSFIKDSEEEEDWRREWVRSEAEASVLWLFRNPSTNRGLYGTIDIGAGTTIANWIMIAQAPEMYETRTIWRNARLSFFGSCCRPPAMDALGIALGQNVHALGVLKMREREDELSLEKWKTYQETLSANADRKYPEAIKAVFDNIFETYKLASGEAYGRYRIQSKWENTKLVLFGGGSCVSLLRRELTSHSPWGTNISKPSEINVEQPPGLIEENGAIFRATSNEHIFLLVAYGLSHYLWDIPQVDTPEEIPPFSPPPPKTLDRCRDILYPK